MSKDFTLEELVSLPSFYHHKVSYSGEKVAFYGDQTGRIELYVMEVEDGEPIQITEGQVPKSPRWPFVWGRDDRYIYFHQDEAGNEQNDIYRLDLSTGETKAIVSLEGQNIIGRVSPDGQWIAFTSDSKGQMNLYKASLPQGEVIQLTDHPNPVMGGYWDPEGSLIAYGTNESDNLENADIYVVSADGAELNKLDLGSTGSETHFIDWSPDGNKILFSDNSSGIRKVGVYDRTAEEVTWMSSGEREERGTGFGRYGGNILATRSKAGGWVPVVYDQDTGDGKELDLPTGNALTDQGKYFNFTDQNDIVLAHTTDSQRKSLIQYQLEEEDSLPLIEPEYGDINPQTFVDSEYITYNSTDDMEIPALLYKPSNLSSDEQAPAIVVVHGGPHGQSLKSFDSFTQYLVNRGYGVLTPNYRGSVGYGTEFKNAIHLDWGGGDLEDVARGGEYLQSLPWVDEDKIVVFGGSYGGYMTYMQLVKNPELWSTGVAYVGITDLLRMYEDSMEHFKYFLRQQMGDPQQNEELWKERSPISYVNNCQPPLLMVHGVNDPRCPVSQARLFKEALEQRGWEDGKEFEYVELGEEGHGSMDVEQRVNLYRLLDDYLDRRL